ncbi:adenylyl-sulfate kinase [Pedobacter sp. MW01-1-1]|uniref:adenylyl-sulfate kinase n=1 Tax=Pedobacter sp. MW01-1-1 TaxID=3383027 RepID=UPI003FEF656F
MALILQFTGLSGAGKTTISIAVQAELQAEGKRVLLLDGDEYRKTLCRDLGFSKTDRIENVRRLGNLAWELQNLYDLIIIAAINPYEQGRIQLKNQFDAKLVYIECSLEQLKNRDPKGLYKKAALPQNDKNKIHNLTGVNDVFEEPTFASLILNTSKTSIVKSVSLLKQFIDTLI